MGACSPENWAIDETRHLAGRAGGCKRRRSVGKADGIVDGSQRIAQRPMPTHPSPPLFPTHASLSDDAKPFSELNPQLDLKAWSLLGQGFMLRSPILSNVIPLWALATAC